MSTHPTRHHWRAFTLLVVSLAALYMLTYSGQIEIADQLQYFDAVSSLAQFGDTRLDLSMWQPDSMPRQFPPSDPLPLKTTIAEPVFIYATAPLFWLAERLEGVGLLHTTYLFNVVLTALVCGAFFWLALWLNFPVRVAAIGALGLGACTVLLPYSQTFFREPLMLFWMLCAALLIESGRHQTTGWRKGWRLCGAAGLLIVAFFTKDAILLALPGYAVLCLPPAFWRNRWIRRLSVALMLALLGGVVLIAYTDLLTLLISQPVTLGRFVLDTEYTRTALHTYLFSLGGSLWGTSPILLLALIGGAIRWRQGDQRWVWAAMLVIVGYTLGYALLRGEEWFGGTIWPQRFLLPAIPFAMLLTLPVLEALTTAKPRYRRIGWALIALLGVYSLWWQYHGVAHRWDEYSRLTYDLSDGGLAYWSPGFNDWRYIRPVMLMQSDQPLNFAWARTGAYGVVLIFGALIGLCGVWTWRRWRGAAWLAVLWAVGVGITLRAIYIDPAYLGEHDALHAMLAVIDEQIAPNEFLLLSDREYTDFFLNYGKTGQVRVLTLPFHPGERGSCDQPLARTSDNPAVLLADLTAPLLHHLAAHNPRLWVLASSAPEIPCVIRPVERFMGASYYRTGEFRVAPTARLIAYHTTPAPAPYAFYGADVPLALRFNTLEPPATLDLIGLHLPRGTHYTAGDWLPVSLYWQAQTPIPRDYTVAWYLVQDDHVLAQGEDSWFGATFAPSSLWTPNQPIWDHRALQIPDTLAAGSYTLWVKVYWQDVNTGAITDLTLADAENGQTVGALPITLHISAPAHPPK